MGHRSCVSGWSLEPRLLLWPEAHGGLSPVLSTAFIGAAAFKAFCPDLKTDVSVVLGAPAPPFSPPVGVPALGRRQLDEWRGSRAENHRAAFHSLFSRGKERRVQ